MNGPIERTAELIVDSLRIVVFVGAGLSAASVIPGFRSPGVIWNRHHPQEFYFQRFLQSETSRAICWRMATEMYGAMKEATISFGQTTPAEETRAAYDHSTAWDLFIVIGSSLWVQPAAQMPVIAKRNGARLVTIHREETPCDPIADHVVHAQAGPAMATVMDRVGRGLVKG